MSATNNRFLQSSLTTNDVATETTLKKVCDKLDAGIEVSGSVDVGNFPDPQNVIRSISGFIRPKKYDKWYSSVCSIRRKHNFR